MAEDKTAVVAVVREWQPQHDDPLTKIHDTIDSWGRPAGIREPRDYAEVEARVDRLTKRVKARTVTVQETVTEWVDEDGTVEVVEGAGRSPETVVVEGVPRGGKRRPRILGFFGPRSAKDAVDKAVGDGAGEPAERQPQCMALTADGQQCLNSARGESKYCASHKGYQPPTAKGIAQRVEGEAWDPDDKVTDAATVRAAGTKPRVRKAKDTPLAVRRSPAAKRSARGPGRRGGRAAKASPRRKR